MVESLFRGSLASIVALVLVVTLLCSSSTQFLSQTRSELLSIKDGKDWLDADVHAQSAARKPTGKREKVAYVGIIPYERAKRRVPHAVACNGQASVGCIVSTAASEVHGLLSGQKPTAGKLLIAKAAKGRGFSEWNVEKSQSKASLEKARQAVKVASKARSVDLLGGIWKGYESLDRDIDGLHKHKDHKAETPADHIQTAIKALESEKAKLRRQLHDQKRAAKLGKARHVVKSAAHGWLDWFDASDRKGGNKPWAY